MSVNRRLPTASKTNITGRRGVTLLQQHLEREDWLFRRQDSGDSDFGVDAEIEVVQRNKVTGRLFKGQIKSVATLQWDGDDEAGVPVKVTTYNMWREMPLLTVLFLVDVATDGIYWTPALAHHPAPNRESLTIKFDKGSDLRHDIGPLNDYLHSWFSVRSRDTELQEVPYFRRIFSDLCSDIDHYDDPGEMFEDEHDRLRLFYQHALRLRLDLGFRNDDIPALADWYAREAATWDSMDTLSWAIFSELMKFITPYYEEAMTRLRERLDRVEPTEDNYRVKNLVERLKGKSVSIVIADPRTRDLGFQRKFEKMLQKAGVVKYPRFDKRRN